MGELALLLIWVHVKILFNIFTNFREVFFQTALNGGFFKERMTSKQERVL